ncbi:hypothetical protein HDU67_004422, partial [Dinochytrium kinnereticum]
GYLVDWWPALHSGDVSLHPQDHCSRGQKMNPAYFVERCVNIWIVLFDADASDYANEKHFVRHLVQRGNHPASTRCGLPQDSTN